MLEYFTDSVLRAPTFGTIFIGVMAALIGVTTVLRRESLVGETLSHAAYPGVMVGVIIWASLGLQEEIFIQLLILASAFFSSLIAYFAILFLQNKLHIKADSSLCFILASFIGIGVFFASILQFSYTSFYKQAQIYLYGQSATLTDLQAILFLLMLTLTVLFLTLFHKEIKIYLFDPELAKTLGLKTEFIKTLLIALTGLALVCGIRAVGVILMSALLIAPPIAARELTHHLGKLYVLSGFFGGLSAFLGTVLSNEISISLSKDERFSMPTGPVIVLTAGLITLLVLFFNPKRGLGFRAFKRWKFQFWSLQENILKTTYKFQKVTFDELNETLYANPLVLRCALNKLIKKGWIASIDGNYQLGKEGEVQARKIIRLHRLWEVYLVNYVGLAKDRVHVSAEEIEHVINSELEKELVILLKDPVMDPHMKPIPKSDS